MSCPACGGVMTERSFEETYGRRVTIDLCDRCQAIWFDGTELLQLSPGATLELFQIVSTATRSNEGTTSAAQCPRCSRALVDASDLQKATRFFFRRCPEGHGRLMSFFQFLRAKNFVRTLSEAEILRLKDRLRQVNCSNCGAPLDVDHSPACAHCGTPISILDPAQLQDTVRRLSDAEAKRLAGPDPALALTLAMERLKVERAFAALDARQWLEGGGEESADLVWAGLRALKRALKG